MLVPVVFRLGVVPGVQGVGVAGGVVGRGG